MTILVVGDVNADVSATVGHFPFEGDDSSINTLQWGSGGSAANVATALALLGQPVQLVARVGTDPASQIALRAARTAGVDCTAIQHDQDQATGLCFVAISPHSESTFFSFRGANSALTDVSEYALPNEWSWLHIAGHALIEGQQQNTTWHLIEQAQRHHVPISLDLCLPLVHTRANDIHRLIPQLQILFANKPELLALFPDMSEELIPAIFSETEPPPPLLVLKLGASGCKIMSGQKQLTSSAIPIKAIDSTGCGDAFVAGFLDRYLNHCTWHNCALYANAVGALTAMCYGSGEALPSSLQVYTFIDTHYPP